MRQSDCSQPQGFRQVLVLLLAPFFDWSSFDDREKWVHCVGGSFVLNFGAIFAWALMDVDDSFTLQTLGVAFVYQALAAALALVALTYEVKYQLSQRRQTRART